MIEIQLRPYQEEIVNKIRAELLKGKHSIVAVLGCGGGKSVIQGVITKQANEKGNRVLFLVHRQELCSQIYNTFNSCGVDFGLCDIMMVQTAVRRLDKIPEPRMIITDEAHHSTSTSYTKIYERFPNATLLGFTATPQRMGEGGLGKVYDALVEGVSTKWLIANNYLAPYKYYSVKLADASGLRVSRGDYASGELAELMEHGAIYGDTVKTWLKYAEGKRTIVYCASCAASQGTAAAFTSAGVCSYHLDGKTPQNERESVVERFRQGDITVLCNCELFGEGFDVPDCECVVLLRPTKSLTLYIQQSMRSMRYKPDKTALIIDHVANVYQHGLPDETREWTLEAKKKQAKGNVLIRECPVCYAVLPAGATICTECGYVFEKQEHEKPNEVDAELVEVMPDDIYRNKSYEYYKQLDTFEEIDAFRKYRGYKFGWTLHKCIERGIEIPTKYNYMVRMINAGT